jgi:hypothetical protein
MDGDATALDVTRLRPDALSMKKVHESQVLPWGYSRHLLKRDVLEGSGLWHGFSRQAGANQMLSPLYWDSG